MGVCGFILLVILLCVEIMNGCVVLVQVEGGCFWMMIMMGVMVTMQSKGEALLGRIYFCSEVDSQLVEHWEFGGRKVRMKRYARYNSIDYPGQ